ncbi:TPA: hypothetical protein KJY93_004667 [Escherichia coli]|nr:hypothetical protein [Escherichia coli]
MALAVMDIMVVVAAVVVVVINVEDAAMVAVGKVTMVAKGVVPTQVRPLIKSLKPSLTTDHYV